MKEKKELGVIGFIEYLSNRLETINKNINIKNCFAEVLKSEIENNDRLVLTVFNEDEKKERKATRVTLFEEELNDSKKVMIKTAKSVIDGFISNFIPSGQKCKIAIENIVFENIERKCKHSSCQLEITISVSYQLIDK